MQITTTRKKEIMNLAEGPIRKQLFRFALPLSLGSLIQQLYNTVDLIFVGQLLGKEASAAVGVGGPIVTCILRFFTGLSVGAGVVIAKAVGEQDYHRLSRTIHTAAGMTILFATLFAAAGLWLAQVFLTWMDTPVGIMGDACVYHDHHCGQYVPRTHSRSHDNDASESHRNRCSDHLSPDMDLHCVLPVPLLQE